MAPPSHLSISLIIISKLHLDKAWGYVGINHLEYSVSQMQLTFVSGLTATK